jgi:mediator of RNA polymerase II transcription subunit 14
MWLRHFPGQLQGSPAILSVPVVQPCLRAEQLLITVDTHSGSLLAHVPQYTSPLLPEIQAAFNSERSRLPALLQELRFWITQRRCEKTLQHLPASAHERLPVMHAADHPIAKLSRHKMFVRLHRHQRVILVVELKEKPDSPCEVDCSFHLVMVKPSSIEDSPEDETIETEFPKTYLRVSKCALSKLLYWSNLRLES